MLKGYYAEVVEFLTFMAEEYSSMRNFLADRDEDFLYELKEDLTKDYGYMYYDNGAPCRIEWGVSKAVFILPEHKFVIKIPFNNTQFDYCYLEANSYKQAKRCGLERHFAACEKMPDYKFYDEEGGLTFDIPIYLMEYAYVNSHNNEQMVSHSNMDRIYKGIDDLNIIRIFSNFYCDDEIIELLEFLNEHGINDFHNGNIGIEDNRPILIDYSGYSQNDGYSDDYFPCCSTF